MIKIKKILSTALLLSAGFFLYGQNIAEEQKELSVIFTNAKLNLDPHTSAYTGEAQILNSTYEGLFYYTPTSLDPEYALISECKTSRDQLYWVFTLKNDAKFSDGSKITSQHVKDSWLKLIATPGAYYSSFLDVIKGAKEYRLGKGKREDVAIFVKDEKTVSIELITPVSHLPKILCHHAFSIIDVDKNVFSGPYRIISTDEEKIILEKNEYYYDAENVHIPKVTIYFSEDAEKNTYLFNTGMVQWVDSIANTKEILNKESLLFEPLFGTHFFFFKEGNPNLTEKVKKALMDATPWEKLRYGSMFPAETFVPMLEGYSKPAPLDFTDYDHAKSLMKEAKKDLGLSEEEMIELTFAIPEGDSIHEAAQVLKNSWARVGVKLNIYVDKNPNYYSTIGSSKADLFIYTWIGDFIDPVAFLEMFKGDSTLNDSGWKNSTYDSLLEKANTITDPVTRLSVLSEAEDILLSSGTVIPVTHNLDMNIVNIRELGGWINSPVGLHPFKDLYFIEKESSFKHGVVALN